MRRSLGMAAAMLALGVLAAAGSPKLVKAGAAENGKTVKLALADTLSLVLDSNPTTGFMWTDKVEGTAIRATGEPLYHGPAEPRPGAGGRQEFRYRAVKAGTAVLNLAYARSFEKGKPPAQAYRLKVVVR